MVQGPVNAHRISWNLLPPSLVFTSLGPRSFPCSFDRLMTSFSEISFCCLCYQLWAYEGSVFYVVALVLSCLFCSCSFLWLVVFLSHVVWFCLGWLRISLGIFYHLSLSALHLSLSCHDHDHEDSRYSFGLCAHVTFCSGL